MAPPRRQPWNWRLKSTHESASAYLQPCARGVPRRCRSSWPGSPGIVVGTRSGDVERQPAANGGHLRLRSREAFLREVFWPIAVKHHARVVGLNLGFDLSRLAYDWRRSRDGGFRLEMFASIDSEGRVWPDRFKPAVRIKSLSSKQQFISFVAAAEPDVGSLHGGRPYPGLFLDLHMLGYALTDRGLSLAGLAAEFGLELEKGRVERHGVLTPDYVDYNRRDVELTWAVHQALVAEFERHPIGLAPEQAYSAAALAKAYLEAAGIQPPMAHSEVPAARIGQAMTAYYGGRTEARIRHTPVAVRYADFSSNYVSVFALARLWDWVVADRLVCRDATAEARTLLAGLDRAGLHDPGDLAEPRGRVLPRPPAGRAPAGAGPLRRGPGGPRRRDPVVNNVHGDHT